MRKVTGGLCLATSVGLLAAPQALACGDKLLVLGRHPRSQRVHGAVQRASILVLLDGRGELAAALREMHLERELTLAGHRLSFVSALDDLAAEVRSGRYDILMADVMEIATLAPELLDGPKSPTLIPIVVNTTGEEWTRAAARLSCIRRSPSLGKHPLSVIESVLRERKTQARAGGQP